MPSSSMHRCAVTVACAFAVSLVAPRAQAQDEGSPIGVPPSAPAGDPAPTPPASAPADRSPPPPAYTYEPAPPPSWPQRKGFTLDVGLGPAYTSTGDTPLEGGFGVAGLSLSLGAFVSSKVAITARFAGTQFWQDVAVVRTSSAGLFAQRSTRSQAFIAGFYGPALQVFLTDHIFLGAGAGLGVLAPSFYSFDADEKSLPDPRFGFALNGRVGFAFLARTHHWLGVVLETIPGFYGQHGRTLGTGALLQWQYY